MGRTSHSMEFKLQKRISEGLENVKKGVLKFAMLKIGHCNSNYSVGFTNAQLLYKCIQDDRPKSKVLSVRFDSLFTDGVKLLSDLDWLPCLYEIETGD